MSAKIIELLTQLKLHGMAAAFPGLPTKAEREGLSHQDDILRPKDMVDALLDRLRHRCCIISIDGAPLRS